MDKKSTIKHHATPNHVDKDPDIQYPFIALSAEQAASRPRALKPLLAIQAFLFVMVFPFQAILLRIASVVHLVKDTAPERAVQLALLLAHASLYGVLLVQLGSWEVALAFAALHQCFFGLYNSSVFASNHKGMDLIDDESRLDFLHEQVLTARNIDGNPFVDFWYGGLNYQIEHHLFPTIPRNKLRSAQKIVREFCVEQGIRYHSTSLFGAYREGFIQLHDAGRGRVTEPSSV